MSKWYPVSDMTLTEQVSACMFTYILVNIRPSGAIWELKGHAILRATFIKHNWSN